MQRQKKGMVLLMVLCVLTLLCLMGLMFVMMVNVERATARAYLDMVRTKMVAQSGIHAAMVNTRALLTEKGFELKDMEYHGEDLHPEDPPTITMGLVTPDGTSCEDQDGDHRLQTSDCPLYRAVRPSFMVDRNNDGQLDENDLIRIKDQTGPKWVGVSGIMPGPYNQTIGAYYAVKVEELSGQICVNMPDHPHMEKILCALVEELIDEGNTFKDTPAVIAKRIADNRPYVMVDEIKAKAGVSEHDFDLLKPYLTTYSWYDKSVIKPLTKNGQLVDRIDGTLSSGQYIYKWETLRPIKIEHPQDKNGNLVGRAPVNINTAPRAVLVALIKDLAGLWLDVSAFAPMVAVYAGFGSFNNNYTYMGGWGSLGKLTKAEIIDGSLARQIAYDIITNQSLISDTAHPWRGRFLSWQQFSDFCDNVLCNLAQPRNPEPDPKFEHKYFLTPQQVDLLKANFNPNSNLSEFNPPYQRNFWVSKTNLTYYTTEFTFFPTGYFNIASLGRLLGPDYQVLAEAEIETVVQLFNIYKETTQQDFLYDYWLNTPAHPGVPIKDIIKQNPDPHFLGGTTDNLTLQTYPEILEWTRDYVKNADYEGYITLATVESTTNASFQIHYNSTTGLNADPGHPPFPQQMDEDTRGPYVKALVCPSDQDPATWKDTPGKLFPDGIYSELGSVPKYRYRPPNLNHLICSLWVKPHFPPECPSNKVKTFLTYQLTAYCNNKMSGRSTFGIYSIPNNSELYSAGSGSWYQPGVFCPGYYVDVGYDNASITAWAEGAVPGHVSGIFGDGIGNSQWFGGMTTPCLNHLNCNLLKYHETLPHSSINRGGSGSGMAWMPQTDWGTMFREGKWLHIGWVHDAAPTKTILRGGFFGFDDPAMDDNSMLDPIDVIYVNGIRCTGVFDDFFTWAAVLVGNGPDYYASNDFLRLGAREGEARTNTAADATLDEIMIWEPALTSTPPAISPFGEVFTSTLIDDFRGAEDTVKGIWRQGRYYRGTNNDPVAGDQRGYFTSRAIDLADAAGISGMPVTIFMVAWTQYVPYKLSPYEGVGVVDLREKGATCQIGIARASDPTFNNPAPLAEGPDYTLKDPGGSPVKYSDGGNVVVDFPIRYRVYFDLGSVDPVSDVIIDPLIFDDITIIYYSVPKFLSWAYRR